MRAVPRFSGHNNAYPSPATIVAAAHWSWHADRCPAPLPGPQARITRTVTYHSGVHPAGLHVEGANGSGVTAARGLPSPRARRPLRRSRRSG
ncbi:hypothetical protein SCOCK_580029 [Actinacidiphila cocklensis]|uniref:Uncharacterized protein n=1 Tax=Actinacidiphila cocklensis TaxID=887465 RepID=A0A9W4GU03_9ACTN|nr:hypothetical protein SCOCK_580029 [Actinacidiphila cocklensis]